MEILVSFCNLRSVPERPALGLLNADTMEFRVLKLPPEVPEAIGMMGLAASGRHLFIGLQVSGTLKEAFNPPGLLVFNRIDFSLVTRYTFELVKDIHSFWLSKNETTLYVVSTGSDEVIEVQLEGARVQGEKVFWRPEPDGMKEDVFHINCIHEWQADLVVSGFGKKAVNEEWNSARNGFICNINKNETLVSGIEHPNSFVVLRNSLAYCASRERKLCFTNDERTVMLPGYARGLCAIGDKIFVGTSAGRKKSKSTGRQNKSLGIDGGDCTVSRINGETLEIEQTVSLRKYAEEIYEFLPLEGASQWPIMHREFLSLEEDWKVQVEKAIAEIKKTIPAGESFILADDNEWQDITEENLNDYHRLFFMERDGCYYGSPPNDATALQELRAMIREQQARYFVIGWPSFWWLDHYTEFGTYLRKKFQCARENNRIIIFNLRRTIGL